MEYKNNFQNKIYDDLVSPSAKSVGNLLSLLPRTVNVWCSKWEKWITNGEESIRLTKEAITEKISKIPEEKLIEPDAYVIVPAIHQLSYCYDSDELREMYANLIVASMYTESKYEVHPSFVTIISQLSPLDALALKEIYKLKGVISTICLRTVSETLKDGIWELLINYSIDLREVYKSPNIMCISFDNLERLGIIKIRYDQRMINEDDYKRYETDRFYIQKLKEIESFERIHTNVQRGLIELTSFGEKFSEICCV